MENNIEMKTSEEELTTYCRLLRKKPDRCCLKSTRSVSTK